jgi:multidrug efflux system membrane fusion protein
MCPQTAPDSVTSEHLRETSVTDAEHHGSARRRTVVLIAASVTLIAVGIAAYWLSSARAPIAPATRVSVPVSIAFVTRQNVPVYMTGLGAVQASLTVGIRPQVDGTLQEVLFTEGQHVRKGDVLAVIDPRLFQAALNEANAKVQQ